jgi:hypothetical protein
VNLIKKFNIATLIITLIMKIAGNVNFLPVGLYSILTLQ